MSVKPEQNNAINPDLAATGMTSKRHLGVVDDYGNKFSAPASIGARLIPARHFSARPRRRSQAGSVLAIDATAETNKSSIEAVKITRKESP